MNVARKSAPTPPTTAIDSQPQTAAVENSFPTQHFEFEVHRIEERDPFFVHSEASPVLRSLRKQLCVVTQLRTG